MEADELMEIGKRSADKEKRAEALAAVERGGICQSQWELATLYRRIRAGWLKLEAAPRKEENRHVGLNRVRPNQPRSSASR